ncbi:hypothetical protein NQ317_019582 [Molorchus minor]|uniref:Tyrosine-protein phosphatase domain-containing protein n=1 Tax=Molorchus minor TaxID=1323400 RepID=A0ABQ9K253_9CUCU|nr:hypothetical protein NQ317_019582 [Molorchus minor]
MTSPVMFRHDSTRVILKNAPNGDYINANYVNMVISNTDVVNRYIATQGPLPSTTEDFWQMVLEEECNLIVMVTTLIERGRAKCHKYWPCVGEVLNMQNAIVKCVNEETDSSGSFIFRDFVLVDVKNDLSREIKHMQYIAWPDHGVPECPEQFLTFIEKVRHNRKGEAPVVVHCSAEYRQNRGSGSHGNSPMFDGGGRAHLSFRDCEDNERTKCYDDTKCWIK